MKTHINTYLFKAFLVLMSLISFATNDVYSQEIIDPITGKRTGMYQQDSTMNVVDTTGDGKKRRIKKPFRSPLFADSLKNSVAFKFNIDLSTAGIEMMSIDTALTDFQKNYPFMKNNAVGAASIGTLGGAASPFKFADRHESYSNSFTNPYGDYFFTPENVPFYNVKKAFTQFEYFTAGQRQHAEEHLFINHAQNISPSSSFDLTYQNNRKRGSYNNQQAINKNLSINFAHTGRQYTLFMGYIYNMADIIENGGVTDISNIVDTVYDPPSIIPVNMLGSNVIRGNQFYITQAFTVPLGGGEIDSTTNFSHIPTLSIGMAFNYSAYRKIYQDTKNDMVDGFYDDWFLNNATTRDSINEKNSDLKLFAKYQPYSSYGAIGTIVGGIGYSNERYYNFNQKDYFAPRELDKKNNMYVYGKLMGGYYQYLRWSAYTKYYALGYRNQDIEFGGDAVLIFGKSKMPLKLEVGANLTSSTAPYWTQNYVSNHYIWHNNFGKELKTEFDFNFKMEKINFEVGVTQSIETNKIYYDENSLPAQHTGAVSVTSLFLKKDFKFGGLHLQHRADFQISSNEVVVPVPKVALNVTYFYDIIVVRNVLNIHLGFDGYYNTKYYAFGYNPAVGQFYNQRDVKLGNYPMIDVFAVGKWKKARFILKVQHVNFGLMDNLNYVQVANHPLNQLMFTFGFSWNFYD